MDVTLSGAVYELTPTGRVPIEGVQFYSSERAVGYTDANGLFRVTPVWVCPCEWAPWVDAGITAIWVEKDGYEAPAGQPLSVFPWSGATTAGYRDVTINGDTRFDIELVRR